MTTVLTRPASPLGQRLKIEMLKRGINSAELAKRADVKTSFIYDVLSGKSANPSTLKLARVADCLGVSLMELAGMPAPAPTPGKAAQASEEYIAVSRLVVDTAGGNVLVTRPSDDESCRFRKAWLRDHLGAAPEALRTISIRGDSMEPTLCNHDVVLVDTSMKTPSPPGIFVLFDGIGLSAKRVEYTPGQTSRLRIASDNTQYSSYECDSKDTLIVGRVVWFSREM